MCDWRETTLNTAVVFSNGRKRPEALGIYPVYGGNGVLNYTSSYNNQDVIIVGRVGAYCGSVFHEPNKCWVSDNAIAGKVQSTENVKYIFYLMKMLQLNNMHIGTSQPLLTQSILNSIKVKLLNKSEQMSIAATLSCLDDKIELNNKINANLEAQAQAIFKSWFISMESDTWDIGQLADLAYINPQRVLKQQQNATYLEMSNLPTQGCFPLGWTKRPYAGGMKFQNGDTLLARITPCLENGKAAYVNFLDENETAYGSTEYIVLAPKSGYPSEMLYYLVRDEAFINYAIKNMTGSTGRQRVSGEALGEYEMPIPPVEFVKDYTSFFRTVMMTIRQNSFQNRILSNIRDTLLPKLMSGEIEV